jgi:uncharacterized protein YijF (DUF1287 family)
MTPRFPIGFVFLAACSTPPTAAGPETKKPEPAAEAPAAAATAEKTLGLADTGVWSDLDDKVTLALPSPLDPTRTTGVIAGDVLVVYVDSWPTKAYPLGGDTSLTVGSETLALRAGDAAELDGALGAVRRLDKGEEPPPGDRDGDHIPDPLDTLIGAKKMTIQGWEYGGQYMTLEYPGGDLPRDMGVCTDVVIRSLRNAGVDLQVEVHKDIARAKKSYPMVKGKGDKNIDHRRVKTILPWFKRHATAHTTELDDAEDPYRPGDIVFMDTLDKPGPDHIGVVADAVGESGHLMVINAWTDGYETQAMDLLGWVPVTHRFRL